MMGLGTKYTYAGLSAKYDGFFVPSGEILIGGQNLSSDLSCRISSLKVSLALSEPDSVSFGVWDCYDFESRSLKSSLKSSLIPGAGVKAKLGYGSSRTQVFSGFLESVSVQMTAEDSFTCQVSAYDVKKLMQAGGKRNRVFRVKSYTEVFSQIMGEYSSLCSVKTDTEPKSEKEFTLEQRGADLEFIRDTVAGRGLPGWNLVISGGEASLCKKKNSQQAALALSPGSGLKSFSWSCAYLNKKVQVLGYSPKIGSLSAEGEVKAALLSKDAPKVTEVISSKAGTQEKVDEILAGRMSSYKEKSKTASLSTIGIPELKPGDYLEISDVDSSVNGTYFITKVAHSLDENGFSTEVTVGG